MEIVYKNKKIHKVCENYNEAKKIHGEQMAAKIHQRIDEIKAAESVEQIYYDINRISGGDNLLIKMAVAYLKPTFESVLKDISNYDDPDREDCTDDLTLSITMSAK